MRIILVLIVFALCGTQTIAQKKDTDLEMLVSWLEGRFSSEIQAKNDTTFQDVRLTQKRIWNERMDGFWILAEQLVLGTDTLPGKQQVYQIRRIEDNMIEMRMYEWKQPKERLGALQDPSKLAGSSPDNLRLQRGCELYLRLDGLMFAGRTIGTACSSNEHGASYMSSELRVFPDGIINWERGYSATGTLVWGAAKGGLQLRKLEGW